MSIDSLINLHMNAIPALLRTSPPLVLPLNKPPTIVIPHMQAIDANSINLRRPNRSTMDVPKSAPMKDVTELTRFKIRCLSADLIPACLRRTGKKSTVSMRFSYIRASDETVPGQLTPAGYDCTDQQAVSVGGCSEVLTEIIPSLIGTGEADVLGYLLQLKLYEWRMDVIVA